MLRNILVTLALSLTAVPAWASCRGARVEVWPASGVPIDVESTLIVVDGYRESQMDVWAIASGSAALVGRDHWVLLAVVSKNIGDAGVTQLLLVPEQPLVEGETGAFELAPGRGFSVAIVAIGRTGARAVAVGPKPEIHGPLGRRFAWTPKRDAQLRAELGA